MKTYYLDANYRLHLSSANGLTPWKDVDGFFDGKCATYIEGYRFIPSGKTWTREDGAVFTGKMFTPWKDYNELDEAQREYELQQIKEMTTTIAELDEALLDATYNNIVGGK